MLEIFTLPFMVKAMTAALITGLLSPAVGTYIVQRRLSLLGDGLGHVAIAGVGLALLTGTSPLPVAIIVCVTGAVIIELLRQNGKTSGDVGLAILFYGGLAAGVLMAGLAGQGAGTLSSYLFGSLLTVNSSDLIAIVVLAVVVIVLAVGLSPQLFAVCVDEDYASTQGINIRLYNLLIVILAALTVTLSMRTVGLLLVSAMMVVPVATAQNWFRSFSAILFGSMAIGFFVSGLGTVNSVLLDAAPGATIVLTSITVFLVSLPFATRLNRSSAVTEEPAIAAPIKHIVAAPHARPQDAEAVLHRDHVDYVHDGHRHAPHGDHWDEH